MIKTRFLILLISLLLTLILYYFKINPIYRFSFGVEDSKFIIRKILHLAPVPFKNAVIVAIDEKSINQLGRWPWDRQIIAKLIKNLYKANLVVLDIIFSERQNSKADKILAQTISENNNVILGFFLRKEATEIVDNASLDLLRYSEYLRYVKKTSTISLPSLPFVEINLPEFMESSLASASINNEPDPDGIYRKYYIAFFFKGSIYFTLAFQAYRFYLNKDFYMELSDKGIQKLKIDDQIIPVIDGQFVKLNFYNDISPFVVSAIDVINKKVDPTFFKNKVVFVGATEIGIYDMRPTPIDPTTPGVFLHFTAFSNLALNQFLKTSKLFNALAIFILIFVTFLSSFIKSYKMRALAYTVAIVFYIIFVNLLFIFKFFDLNLFYPSIGLLLSTLFQEGTTAIFTEKRIRHLRKAFESYVSPQLLEIIVKNPNKLKLGGEKKEIAVLFSDIRGFTSISEEIAPEKLISLLNEYFDPITQIILDQRGMLDKYIGDAIMAIFNAPIDIDHFADRACISALEMLNCLEKLNPIFRKKYNVVLDIGIGINTGYAVIGNIGSSMRFDYTAIGDVVNLASRLEGLNKLYKTRIIISESTKNRLTQPFLTRKLDLVAAKGKKKAILIFELLKDNDKNRKIVPIFEKAINLYFKGEFKKALKIFEKLAEEYDDKTSLVFIERCKQFIANPPHSWDGIFRAQIK